MNDKFFEFMTEGSGARLKVVGVGGGGSNAVNTMVHSGLKGVDFIVANTDQQALEHSAAEVRLQIGANLTQGLALALTPRLGATRREDQRMINELMSGADMVFITAGMAVGLAPALHLYLHVPRAKLAHSPWGLSLNLSTLKGRLEVAVRKQGLRHLQQRSTPSS